MRLRCSLNRNGGKYKIKSWGIGLLNSPSRGVVILKYKLINNNNND